MIGKTLQFYPDSRPGDDVCPHVRFNTLRGTYPQKELPGQTHLSSHLGTHTPGIHPAVT